MSILLTKYILLGANKQRQGKAWAHQGSVLASTVESQAFSDSLNEVETRILHHPEASEPQDSDYESDPDPMGDKRDTFVLTSLILPCRTTLYLRYPADRSIIHTTEKQLKTSKDWSKKTSIAARIHGDGSVVRRVSNSGLGSFKLK